MSLEGVVHCDESNCPIHAHVGPDTMRANRLPVGWILHIEYGSNGPDHDTVQRFCSNDCAMRKLAELPPTEHIPVDGDEQ